MLLMSDSLYRQVPQVDFCSCLRCGRVAVAAFVFDDGTFYCHLCFSFMLCKDPF